MVRVDGAGEDDELRLGRGGYLHDATAPGRWVNPLFGVLGILILSGYLMTGRPSAPAATVPAPPSNQPLASAQVPPQPALGKGTVSLPHSGVAQHEPTFSSMSDTLKAAFGAVVALAWAVFGAWLGMRHARRPEPLDGPEDDTRATDYPSRTAHDLRRAPTCERMYDETRLVPQYLRSARFPAMKHDLVRLAREHIDEGQALRRLECIPDRCYSSLHDLITEIRVD